MHFEKQPACSAEPHLINLQSHKGPLSTEQPAEISISASLTSNAVKRKVPGGDYWFMFSLRNGKSESSIRLEEREQQSGVQGYYEDGYNLHTLLINQAKVSWEYQHFKCKSALKIRQCFNLTLTWLEKKNCRLICKMDLMETDQSSQKTVFSQKM